MMNKPIAYRTMLELAHKIYRACREDEVERAKELSALLSALEIEFPDAKRQLDEDYPRA